MPKLKPEQLPFRISTGARGKDGFYADLHPDGSVAALYDYRNGLSVYEAHFAEDYLSGYDKQAQPFEYTGIGYIDGWTDFDGAPSIEAEAFDALPQDEQERIEIYQEFVEWIKSGVFPHFMPRQRGGGHSNACSFCGKGEKEVARLIAGPSAFICNECVDMCRDILES